jgi:hypothetical protein
LAPAERLEQIISPPPNCFFASHVDKPQPYGRSQTRLYKKHSNDRKMDGRKMFTSLCRPLPPDEHCFDDPSLYFYVIHFSVIAFLAKI